MSSKVATFALYRGGLKNFLPGPAWLLLSKTVPLFSPSVYGKGDLHITEFDITESPAYSDTVYSDTPLTVILLACPK